MDTNNQQKEREEASPVHTPDFKPLSLAFELGYTIAIPLVVFALIGRLMDKHYGSSPLWLIVGLVLSIAITTFLLVRKMKDYF